MVLSAMAIVFTFALCSVQAAQEALGKPIDSQQLTHQSSSQRIINASTEGRYTPEMLSERRIRKYRRPVVFSPIKKENLKTLKKRKTFLLDTN